MLQTIHDKLKGIFAITILVALGVVFVFWGINFSTDFGGFARAQGIEVNGREVPVEEVRQDYQEQLSRMQAAFGEAGVPERDAERDAEAGPRPGGAHGAHPPAHAQARLRGDRRRGAGGDPPGAGVPGGRQVLAGRVSRGAALDQHVAGTLRGRAAPVRARAPARPRPLQLGLRAAGRARAARRAPRGDAHHRLGRGPGARVRGGRLARRRGHRRVLRGEPVRAT